MFATYPKRVALFQLGSIGWIGCQSPPRGAVTWIVRFTLPLCFHWPQIHTDKHGCRRSPGGLEPGTWDFLLICGFAVPGKLRFPRVLRQGWVLNASVLWVLRVQAALEGGWFTMEDMETHGGLSPEPGLSEWSRVRRSR